MHREPRASPARPSQSSLLRRLALHAGLVFGLSLMLLAGHAQTGTSPTPAPPAAPRAGLTGTVPAAAVKPSAPRVSFVVQLRTPAAAVDAHIQAHLTARGFDVTLIDQTTPAEAAPAAELVIISSTVSAKDVDRAWRHVPVPLLTWENDLLDDLAMTGKRHDTDFGEAPRERFLWIVNAPHPMADGLPAGVTNVHLKQAPMSWGRPGPGAITIATLYGQPDKAALFGYEKGATMDYESLAPARRVMIFLDNEGFANLAPEGRRLFDAAVDWAVGRR